MSENTLVFSSQKEKDWLKALLSCGVHTVYFIKKDGTARKMRCTLMESEIPAANAPKGTGKAKSEDALAVFDVEANGWRSFRYDSITRIEGDL